MHYLPPHWVKNMKQYYDYELPCPQTFSIDTYARKDGYHISQDGNFCEKSIPKSKKNQKPITVRIYTEREKIPLSEQKRILDRLGYTGKIISIEKIGERKTIPRKYVTEAIYEIPLKKGEVIIKPKDKRKPPEIWQWNRKKQQWEYIELAKVRRKFKGFKSIILTEEIPGELGYVDITFLPYYKTKRIKRQIEIFYTLDYKKVGKERHIIIRILIDCTIATKPEFQKETEWIDKMVNDIKKYLTLQKCQELLAIIHPNLDKKNSSTGVWFDEKLDIDESGIKI